MNEFLKCVFVLATGLYFYLIYFIYMTTATTERHIFWALFLMLEVFNLFFFSSAKFDKSPNLEQFLDLVEECSRMTILYVITRLKCALYNRTNDHDQCKMNFSGDPKFNLALEK